MSCFAPSNFSVRQAAYVDGSCWDSLVHHEQDEDGQYKTKSLWPHKVRQPQLSIRPAEWKETDLNHTPSHRIIFPTLATITFMFQAFFKCRLNLG